MSTSKNKVQHAGQGVHITRNTQTQRSSTSKDTSTYHNSATSTRKTKVPHTTSKPKAGFFSTANTTRTTRRLPLDGNAYASRYAHKLDGDTLPQKRTAFNQLRYAYGRPNQKGLFGAPTPVSDDRVDYKISKPTNNTNAYRNVLYMQNKTGERVTKKYHYGKNLILATPSYFSPIKTARGKECRFSTDCVRTGYKCVDGKCVYKPMTI